MGFDLDPIETTQYEVGMSYQILPSAAIDVTAFAKNTTGQVVIGKNEEVDISNEQGVAQDAFYYKNGDFTTVNGLFVRGDVSYTDYDQVEITSTGGSKVKADVENTSVTMSIGKSF